MLDDTLVQVGAEDCFELRPERHHPPGCMRLQAPPVVRPEGQRPAIKAHVINLEPDGSTKALA
jgi:hypothetical protein